MTAMLTTVLIFSFTWVGGAALGLAGASHAYRGDNAKLLFWIGLCATAGAIVLSWCAA